MILALALLVSAIETVVVPDPEPWARTMAVICIRVLVYGLFSALLFRRALGRKKDVVFWAVMAILALGASWKWTTSVMVARDLCFAALAFLGGYIELWQQRRLAAAERLVAAPPSRGDPTR